MLNTEKETCRMIAAALRRYGCRYAVVSPGTRSAPMIMALTRQEGLETVAVVDERSAAFIALGHAEVAQEPVGLVCTSGTALLNYAPAVAEAYYKLIPLIVISADRPASMIDQDDSQTIRQEGSLANITLASYSLRGEIGNEEQRWHTERTINDALLRAIAGPRRGPVHINLHLSEPLTRQATVSDCWPLRKIDLVKPEALLSVRQARDMAAELTSARVMVVAGFMSPDNAVSRALAQLAQLPNVVVLAEGLANLHCGSSAQVHTSPDSLLSAMSAEDLTALRPQVLITVGGALVSRLLKEYLRGDGRPQEHWHVGCYDMTIDCYRALTRRVEIPPPGFFPRLANAMRHLHLTRHARRAESTFGSLEATDYAARWNSYEKRARELDAAFTERAPWSDYKAISTIFSASLPKEWNLRLGNGMALRYALLQPLERFHRVDGNRGTSGIDGCTSTALGASTAYSHPTLLLTGDMGAQYDLSALGASRLLSPRLEIIVMANGDGSIFRFIRPTSSLPETDEFMAMKVNLPLRQLAAAYGFRYLRAASVLSLERALQELIHEQAKPCILEVITSSTESAAVARLYFNRLKFINL